MAWGFSEIKRTFVTAGGALLSGVLALTQAPAAPDHLAGRFNAAAAPSRAPLAMTVSGPARQIEGDLAALERGAEPDSPLLPRALQMEETVDAWLVETASGEKERVIIAPVRGPGSSGPV